MSKLSKHNRYQKGKPAPVKALPAIGAIVAKVAPVVKGLVAKGGASGAASGGGKGEVVKNLIQKFSNKRKSNTDETAQEKDYYADQSGGDFSHLNSMAPFAMNSPFKKKPGSNNDAVSVTSSVKGVSNQQTGTYDVEARDITLVAGSSGDPLAGKGNTAEDAISASGEIDGTKITTTETPTSLAQQKNNQTTVNPSTGNVVSNNFKPSSNPNTAEAAINESSGSKKPVIGNETRLGSMHNKHYWERNKRGDYVKRNDNLWVRERPDEGGPKEVRYTNPFNDKPAAKPDPKPAAKPDPKPAVKPSNTTTAVAPDLNKKKSDKDPTTQGYLKISSSRYQEGFNKGQKWFPGLNNAVKDREEYRKKGDKAGEAHTQAIIDKLRASSELNKTQNNDPNKKSQYTGEFSKGGTQINSRKGDSGNKLSIHKFPASGNTNIVSSNSKSPKIDSNIKGNTSNVKDIKMQDVNVAENRLANISHTKRVAREAGLDNIIHTRDYINSKDPAANVQSKPSKVNSEKTSSSTSKKTTKKITSEVKKENKKKVNKPNTKKPKVRKTKTKKGKRNSGMVKVSKNPLFKS